METTHREVTCQNAAQSAYTTKIEKDTIPNAHHMFRIPISLQTPLISPSEFIPQIFFIRLTTSSPQTSRICSDASPRLHFNVCEYENEWVEERKKDVPSSEDDHVRFELGSILKPQARFCYF